MTSNNTDAIKFEQNGSCIINMGKITFEQATRFVAYPVSLDGKSYGQFPKYEWMYLHDEAPLQIKRLLFKFEKIVLTGPNFPYASMKDVPGKGTIDMGPKKANVSFSFDEKFNEGVLRVWNYFELCFRAAYLMTIIGTSQKYLTLYPYFVKEATTKNTAGTKVMPIENFYNFNFLLHDCKPEKNFFTADENSDPLFAFYSELNANKNVGQYVLPASVFTIGDITHARLNLHPSLMTKNTRKNKAKEEVPIDRIYLSPDFCMPKNGKVRLLADTKDKKATTPEELKAMQTLSYWGIRVNVAIPDKATGSVKTILYNGKGINLIDLTPEIRAHTDKVDTADFEHKNKWMKLTQSNPEFNKLPVIVGNKSDSEKNMFMGCCTVSFSSVGVGMGVSKSHFMVEELCAIPGTVEIGNRGVITGDTMDLGDEPFSSAADEDSGLELAQ